MEAPKLLIGLGGIGSRIVDAVYGRIPLGSRGRVAVQIFDTDVNDLDRLNHLSEKHMIQTSTQDTVGNYLRRADLSVQDWFPGESQQIRDKLLTEGAGQIRAISRLAYRAAMQSGKLGVLQQNLNEIFTVSGDPRDRTLRILVVSSLGGGTGSGIFIQTALYLRWLLASQGYTPMIRGVFVLPEILVDTGLIPENQRENVEANAYACLKEVNQILQLGSGRGNEIDLEFRPDQLDMAGRQDHAIRQDVKLYDTLQLMGYKNTANLNLRSYEDYMAQVVDGIYLNMFTSVGNRQQSSEDNFLRESIESGGLNRYGSFGVAGLSYPYEDMIRYCGLRWVTDSISDEWLHLDRLFREEMDAYTRDATNGISMGEKPDIQKRYVELLALEGDPSKSGGKRFFKICHRMTCMLDQEGNVGDRTKARAYIEALEAEMARLLEKEVKILGLEQAASPDYEQLRSKRDAAVHVASVENALRKILKEIEAVIPQLSRYVLRNTLYAAQGAPRGMVEGDASLNTWILGKDAPIHPVAFRALLYGVLNEVSARFVRCGAENADLRKQIQAYEKAYDVDETERIDTAADRVDRAASQRVLSTRLKAFAEEYQDKAERQKRRLIQYKTGLLHEKVFGGMQEALKVLILEVESYFRTLEDTSLRLLGERNRLAVQHENGDPTRSFVLATKEMKDRLWEEVQGNTGGKAFPEELSRELYLDFYQRFCNQMLGDEGGAAGRGKKTDQDILLNWCMEMLRSAEMLRLNIVEALEKEARFLREDTAEHIRKRIAWASRSASPFIRNMNHGGQLNRYWAVHPTCREVLERYINPEEINGIVADEAFSPWGLIRYISCVGLEVSRFEQFSDGEESVSGEAGRYFRAYQKFIRALGEESRPSVTPHLDKRWHLQVYMADINKRQAELDVQKRERAFIFGLGYQNFELIQKDSGQVWGYAGETRHTELRSEKSSVGSGVLNLWRALGRKPAVVESILRDARKAMDTDIAKFPVPDGLEQHRFIRNCCAPYPFLEKRENMLDLLLCIPKESPHEDLVEVVQQLLEAMVRAMQEYFEGCYGQHRPETARKALAEMLQKQQAGSLEYQGMEKNAQLRLRCDRLFQKFMG